MSDNESKNLSVIAPAGRPLKTGEIAYIAGIPKDKVAKTIASLKKQGRVKTPETCYYQTKQA